MGKSSVSSAKFLAEIQCEGLLKEQASVGVATFVTASSGKSSKTPAGRRYMAQGELASELGFP